MWSEATSNGFRVDFSPPDAVEGPTVDETLGIAVKNTQVNTIFCVISRKRVFNHTNVNPLTLFKLKTKISRSFLFKHLWLVRIHLKQHILHGTFVKIPTQVHLL